MFYSDGAPTAGPPPFHVYEVAPTLAFGFPGTAGTSETARLKRVAKPNALELLKET